MKIAVITDSSAGVSQAQAAEYGIYVARMPLTIDGKEYIEEEGISRIELIAAMRRGAKVSTSQPPLGVLIETFESLLKEYDHVIFLPISSKLSGTYQTALGLASDFDNRITVIDSQFVAAPLLLLSVDVKKMADMGMDPLKIKEKVEREAEMFAPLIPEDIQYLKRGGRITPAAAAIANLLKIIPVLKVANGEIDVLEKVRTHKKALKVGFGHVFEGRNIDEYEWIVLDGDCDPKTFESLVEDVEKHIGRPAVRELLYPIVLAHTGPGSIALCAYKKLI
ncbi:DegV family protein [Erysipelothrix sp. HDW6C]|uniref:DegV family protein n=1 Tax=Erysipelothrix sp. HDW6C TaxID=2714930 RepID=UPI00140B46E3|nr:DegV family protein [Erysipelothrix sp. HDW6C]QIK69376.1 DegV family protein [Erysipelothrix sp. HDW6C]